MFKFLKKKLKSHHYHFMNGGIWGVLVVVAVGALVIGGRGGYLSYWFGGDYKIVNAHEAIQNKEEAGKLLDVMRRTNIQKTILVGAPNQVLFYDGTTGFTGYEKNNNEILEAQDESPSRLIAFCTIDPTIGGYMEEVADCVSRGARGFKLYSGHAMFNVKPLDDPISFPFYDYVQKQGLPVIFHVNSPKFQEEFESVLKRYPDMKVICPHFCLTSNNLQSLSYLFDTYPNLYSDLSFGNEQYLREGIERLSTDPSKYREFIEKYATRFFYGTDMVVTDYEGKDEAWMENVVQIYRDLLEKKTFTTFLTGDTEWNGLNLSPATLRTIYEKNWAMLTKDK